ncbi:nitroreductase family protein [Candidatus Woesearchaeota archaeon]|nr:nitroreductase family protein [Candidatus Woesearchaeota archaeon]
MMRISDYDINDMILNRWSRRAMSGETMTDEDIMPLFEAARWAPSAMNNQLWQFSYAKRDTEHWQKYFDLLMEGNKVWCKDGAVLIIILSRKISFYKDKPHRTHAFEAGAAMQNLLLEATSRKLVAHPMGGFDRDAAREMLKINDNWEIQCMVVVGKPGKKENLPSEFIDREVPSDRRKVSEIICEGKFKDNAP